MFWQWDVYFPRLCYTEFCPEIHIRIINQINAQKSLSLPILVATIQSQSHYLKIHCASLLEKLLFYTLKKKNFHRKWEKKQVITVRSSSRHIQTQDIHHELWES